MPRRQTGRTILLALVPGLILAACSGSAASQPPAGRTPETGVAYEHTVTAKAIAFDVLQMEVKADQPFQVYFRNEDPSAVPHDIDIRDGAGNKIVEDKPTINGGTEVVYDFKALPAGTYKFECSVHPIPAMTGTLTVK